MFLIRISPEEIFSLSADESLLLKGSAQTRIEENKTIIKMLKSFFILFILKYFRRIDTEEAHTLEECRSLVLHEFAALLLQDDLPGGRGYEVAYAALVVDDAGVCEFLVRPGHGVGVHAYGGAVLADGEYAALRGERPAQYLLVDGVADLKVDGFIRVEFHSSSV